MSEQIPTPKEVAEIRKRVNIWAESTTGQTAQDDGVVTAEGDACALLALIDAQAEQAADECVNALLCNIPKQREDCAKSAYRLLRALAVYAPGAEK